MLPIIWSETALDDLDKILEYVAARNEAAATALQERIEASVEPVARHPYLFRAGRVAGTREIVAHPNYIVIYRVLAEHIEVSAVLHSRQQYPSDDEPQELSFVPIRSGLDAYVMLLLVNGATP
ncbi:MAG: type II toxin-antitoxin system RelE/ParE family toxin [Devosia sp.]|nr:type II toxin-antitoxin system RelE/ParE family toxin [Devosia sp.]